MASLTAAYPAERHDPKKLVELVVSAVLVFWLAFVYAQALARSELVLSQHKLFRPRAAPQAASARSGFSNQWCA